MTSSGNFPVNCIHELFSLSPVWNFAQSYVRFSLNPVKRFWLKPDMEIIIAQSQYPLNRQVRQLWLIQPNKNSSDGIQPSFFLTRVSDQMVSLVCRQTCSKVWITPITIGTSCQHLTHGTPHHIRNERGSESSPRKDISPQHRYSRRRPCDC